MTLPEACKMDKPVLKKSMNIGEAVKEVLLQALSENRITYGVYACAKELEISPETVMLCVLPHADQVHDVAIHIQHTLMEAYCLEHDIQILKVDESRKLAAILAYQQDSANNNEQTTDDRLLTDFSSVIIQNPKQKSNAEQFVVDFCHMVSENEVFPKPKIELPELTILLFECFSKKYYNCSRSSVSDDPARYKARVKIRKQYVDREGRTMTSSGLF